MVDPRNALDSATYHDIAAGIAAHGLLSPWVPFLPFYPAGYSVLIGAVYSITGPDPEIARLVSLVLLAIAIYLAWHLIARELGQRLAWLVAGTLAFSPALTGVASVLSYEPLLIALLVFAADQVSRAVHAPPGRMRWHTVAAGLALSFGLVVQSKSAVVLVVLGIWLLYRTRRPLLIGALCLLALSGPVAYGFRTEHVFGHFQLSTSANFGAVMVAGFRPRQRDLRQAARASGALPARLRREVLEGLTLRQRPTAALVCAGVDQSESRGTANA